MPRPPKDPALLMNVPLRVLLTADQKALIDEAARLDKLDTAAWVRPILLGAASARVAQEKAGRARRK